MRARKVQSASVSPTRIALLFGAGISRPGPTNLPLANDVIEAIRENLQTRAGEPWGAAAQDEQPQFEAILDCIQVAGGSLPRLLRVFDRVQPNSNHRLLAQLGVAGCSLITTNFDTNVEASIRTLNTPVRVLRTTQQANAFDTRGHAVPVLKLHGSVCTPSSIVTTVSGLLRRGSMRSPSMLAAGRKKALARLLEGRICFALGYSGSDRLDIVPALRGIRRCWIVKLQHDRSRMVAREELRSLLEEERKARSRSDWRDQVLRCDTTPFLEMLAAMCGLRPAASRPSATVTPDLAAVQSTLGALSPDQARRAMAAINGARSRPGHDDERARDYLARLQRGGKPVVLAGGTVLFSIESFRSGKEKASPESVFRLGRLSLETRATLCTETAAALVRSHRFPDTARALLGQAANLWGLLGKENEKRRAEKLLSSLSGRAREPARRR